jgi:ribosomal-protein-alanine N-acetyltransferase
MSAECSLRRAASEDLAAVLGIERACAEASHWSEAMWREMLEQASGAEAARVVFVADRAGEVVGFAVVQSAGGSAELEGVAVAPEARRRGVGRALCNAAMAWAAERNGAAEMHLEVRASNAAALRLYGALGFVERGRRGGYYRNPVEDAVVMAREAGSSLRSE